MKLTFKKAASSPLSILCLGAHSDDIEIGCGGTLLQLRKAYPNIRFHWVVFSAVGSRAREAKSSAKLFTAGYESKILLKEYRDGFLPYSGGQVKDFFEELKGCIDPDLIFTHWQGDAHQDHRLICELTWNTFRKHLILEYEIPKYDGDMGRPNVFVPLEKRVCKTKVENLLKTFVSQSSKPWFDREAFMGVMRIRGMESNSPSGYAEGFYCRKALIGSIA